MKVGNWKRSVAVSFTKRSEIGLDYTTYSNALLNAVPQFTIFGDDIPV